MVERWPELAAVPELTEGQRVALDGFEDWLTASEADCPLCSAGMPAPADVPIRPFSATGRCRPPLLDRGSTTHKAVEVLRQRLRIRACAPPGILHHPPAAASQAQPPEEQERCDPTEQTATALEHLGLVLVDESSMVDSRLLEITLQCAHTYGTRLVFVGDPAQLPPVSEESSPVFAMKRPKPITFRGGAPWRPGVAFGHWITPRAVAQQPTAAAAASG